MVQGFGGDWRRKRWLKCGGMQRLMMAEKPQTTRGRGDTVRVPPNPMVAAMWRLSRLLTGGDILKKRQYIYKAG
ncbi:hypothetical protein Hanom_Chr02g00124201 [Helianthus anomalus]